jgi:pimeloyl-ACP methyl ester carboxylesterase
MGDPAHPHFDPAFHARFPRGVRVFALDLLGFGHSEKPSVTYTQYLWQDQVRDFALEVLQSPFFIAGNSIGGFTAASVAADIGPLCQGLILINTAGKVTSPEVGRKEGGGKKEGRRGGRKGKGGWE